MNCRRQHRRTDARALVGATLVGLIVSTSACGDASPWTPPAAPTRDEQVAGLIPTGSYLVEGRSTAGGDDVATIEGFVDFGRAVDGIDCEADYTIDSVIDGTIAAVRAAGGPIWYRMVDKDGGAEWVDGSNPVAVGSLAMLFAPAAIAGDLSPGILPGAGTGDLCVIGVLPRITRLDGDRLVFDPERSAMAVAAGRGQWTLGLIDAAGISGADRDEIARALTAVFDTDFAAITAATTITLETDRDGVVTIVQYVDDVTTVTMRLTPTDDRTVVGPATSTFFAAFAERVANVGVESAVAEIAS